MNQHRCASCGALLVGGYVYHERLGVYVHGTDECMRDVHGEDIRLQTVRWVSAPERPFERFLSDDVAPGDLG